jgi:hypothetical protein
MNVISQIILIMTISHRHVRGDYGRDDIIITGETPKPLIFAAFPRGEDSRL